LYVAAQAGIFSFLINYMTEDAPAIPAPARAGFCNCVDKLPVFDSWRKEMKGWIDVKTKLVRDDITDLPSLADRLTSKPDAVSAFINSELSDESKRALEAYKDSPANAKPLLSALAQDLNKIVRRVPKKAKEGAKEAERGEKKAEKDPPLYDPDRFREVKLGETTRALLQEKDADSARLNRLLLADAYPGTIAFKDGVFGISDPGAAILASVGFIFFVIGRFSGAALLRKASAHKILGLYGLMNVIACLLVFLKLGWLSVACVFLSYFFMSIMFPTIFALGIFGLGARAKRASAFIVMAIMGGAILPKLMGYVADVFDMSRGFIVPMFCFIFVAYYGFNWPKFSKAESLGAAPLRTGH
jgi:hypothetical protein